MSNFLSRGTTKEGKEVVGYYNTFDNKHYILEKVFTRYSDGLFYGLNEPFIDYFTEITSPPQKCLGIRDVEGELVFVGDRGMIENGTNEYIVKYDEDNGCYVLVSDKFIKPLSAEIMQHYKFKIIHPTNKGK